MKTRIISGVVAIIIVALVLALNVYFPIISVFAMSFLSAIAVVEILFATGCIKEKIVVISASVFAFLYQFSTSGVFHFSKDALSLVYLLIIVVISLRYYKEFTPEKISMSIAMPFILSFAFSILGSLINSEYGLFYLLLVFNFASISDICAYFVGTAIGKTKLAPEISPKKTVEGSIGGLVGSIIGSIIIGLLFMLITDKNINFLVLVAITPLLSIVGMIGDLFASAIKRYYKIKDYGNIMPGHGGVLDRLDSFLLVTPVFVLILNYVEVIAWKI